MPDLDTLLAETQPRPDLVVDRAQRLPSAEVNDQVARLAGGLRERGVRRGQAVAFRAPNTHLTLLLLRACWRIAAVAVPLHHRAGAAEVDRMVDAVGATFVVDPREIDTLMEGRPVLESAARPSELACVLFTAGSTGTPKGVLHTHRSLAGKAALMGDVHGLTPDDSVLMPAPLGHVSGLLNGVLVPGVVPMKTVLMDRWDPERALDLIEAERITFMVGPPTFFAQLTGSRRFTPERVDSLRLVSSGGAGVTAAFVEEAAAALGAVVKRTYGSTEAPTVATSHAGDDPRKARETDGRPVGAVELRIVDPERGEDLPAGMSGEVWVRGPEVCAGYLDREETKRAFAKGAWFRTGDLGVLDAGGWLTITGRLKDVIIRGGENVSVSEVTGILEAHPDVKQAVVLGEPDAEMGERVVAFVVASSPFDLGACRAWFEDQGVARFKMPERVLAVDAIPTLPTGKPDQAALRHLLPPPRS